jgi:hypothetical protein
MTITYHADVFQGSDEWLALRCGVLTASKMKDILTSTFKIADNKTSRDLVLEIAAQRITNYIEPECITADMIRGQNDEAFFKEEYYYNYGKNLHDIGFITNDKWGFTIGYSPDGLVGTEGLIEGKSRKQKFQLQTIVEGVVPDEFKVQIQTGLLVSERKWCDFISYCGGMHMLALPVEPDLEIQGKIIEAATRFEQAVSEKIEQFNARLKSNMRLTYSKRRVMEEMI